MAVRQRSGVGFLQRETGSATVFGMMVFTLLLVFAGLAIDSSNLFRNRAQMQMTADIAAHSGVARLVHGGSEGAATADSLAAIERGMPAAQFGTMIDDVAQDVQVLHYDATSRQLDHDGPANAVLVHLQRSRGLENAIPTFLLGLLGVESWNLETSSVVALVPLRGCSNAEGIFARRTIALGHSSSLSDGVCLHSQQAIDLPTDLDASTGVQISLPRLSNCAPGCTPAENLRFAAHTAEINMIMPDLRIYVATLAAGFVRTDIQLDEEVRFFATRPLDGDLSALDEVSVDTEKLKTGSVVQMDAIAFSQMRERPSGLVYDVECAENGLLADDPWENTITLFGTGEAPTLRNLVLVTNCAITMDDLVTVEGALVISLREGALPLQVGPGTILGDPAQSCNASRRSTLMSLGRMLLPASLTASNLALVAAGDVTLSAGPQPGTKRHHGTTIHAGGEVQIEGSQSFESCAQKPDPVLPQVELISYVMPSLNGLTQPMRREDPRLKMPGEAAKPLQSTAGIKDEGLATPPKPGS